MTVLFQKVQVVYKNHLKALLVLNVYLTLKAIATEGDIQKQQKILQMATFTSTGQAEARSIIPISHAWQQPEHLVYLLFPGG